MERIRAGGDADDWLSGPQAARLLGVSAQYVRRLCGARRGRHRTAAASPSWPPRRTGENGAFRIRRGDLAEFAATPQTADRPGRLRRHVDDGEELRRGDDARRQRPAAPLRRRPAHGERHGDRPPRPSRRRRPPLRRGRLHPRPGRGHLLPWHVAGARPASAPPQRDRQRRRRRPRRRSAPSTPGPCTCTPRRRRRWPPPRPAGSCATSGWAGGNATTGCGRSPASTRP